MSAARNTGLRAATGEIVAYVDDDAPPDPHWLIYLAWGFLTTDHAAIGGPNIPPAGDGLIADCVAHAPGGPVHVLLADRLAEHVPGVQSGGAPPMSRRDQRFRSAFPHRGGRRRCLLAPAGARLGLGFSHAAMVWHHRRGSLRAYWKQQQGYGRAEAPLEQKWPEKYNSLGHLTWQGEDVRQRHHPRAERLAWPGLSRPFSAVPFQSIYQPAPACSPRCR